MVSLWPFMCMLCLLCVSKTICTVSKLSFKDKDETIEMGKRGEIWAGVCVGVCVVDLS